jgi:CRP/FNR family transcriptional regulator, cyclic AMP receptor protein
VAIAGGRFWNLLSTDDRTAFRQAGVLRTFPAGTVIVHEGDPSQHVIVVIAGSVKVTASVPGGGEFILGLRGPGDILGEMATIDQRPRRGTISAISRTETLVVPGDRFARLKSEHPGISVAIQRGLDEADRYRLSAGSVGVAQRLARLLLDLADGYGTDVPGGGRTIGLPLPQRDLASLLATSPRTVARTLKSWRRAGLVRTGRRHIVISLVTELRRVADGPERVDGNP